MAATSLVAPALGSFLSADKAGWTLLGTPPAELQLDFTLPTGQSFRWQRTGDGEFTGVIGQRVVSMRRRHQGVQQRLLSSLANKRRAQPSARPRCLGSLTPLHNTTPTTYPPTRCLPSILSQVRLRQLEGDVAYRVLARGPGACPAGDAAALHDYFNLRTSLAKLAQEWAAADARFAHVHPSFLGERWTEGGRSPLTGQARADGGLVALDGLATPCWV